MKTQIQKILNYLWTWKHLTSSEANDAGNTVEGSRYIRILRDRGFTGYEEEVVSGVGRPYKCYWIKRGITFEMINFDKCILKPTTSSFKGTK